MNGWTDLGRRTLPDGSRIDRLLIGKGHAITCSATASAVSEEAAIAAVRTAATAARTLGLSGSRVQPVILTEQETPGMQRHLVNDGEVAASVIVTAQRHIEDVTRLAPRRRRHQRRAVLTAALLPVPTERTPHDDDPRRVGRRPHNRHRPGTAARRDIREGMPPGGVTGVICQAESVEIGVGEDDADPFDATFLLAGTDPEGREVAVWIRLTPTTINDLTEQLGQVLAAQHQILGVTGQHSITDVDSEAADEDDPDPGEGRVKRFFDPMGIRHLKDRSPRTTVILGAAIASLVILAFILQQLRG